MRSGSLISAVIPTCACQSSRTAAWPGCGRTAASCRTPASSDDFYTSARLLNRPDTARSMGEGWETRRRRDGGPDHVVIRLAFPGHVKQLIVDTAHFKYNASAEIAVQ